MAQRRSPIISLTSLLLFLNFFFIALPLMLTPATSVATEKASEQMVPLQIAAGTNLIHIARDYCYEKNAWKTIAKINKLTPPYTIYRKRTLMVPLSLLIAEQLAAKVATVNGQVLLVSGDGQDKELAKGDTILPGQTVVTGENGYTHLLFPDHKYTRIEPDSKLTLGYLLKLTDGSIKVDFFLEKGRVIQSVEQKLKENETFQTRTPVSITGIRGTEFRLKMDDSTNIVETLKGRVEVQAGGSTIGLLKGQGTKVEKGKQPAPVKKLPAPPTAPELEPVYRLLPTAIKAPLHKKAETIRLRLTLNEQGTNSLLEQRVAPGDTFVITSLEDGTYFVFFTAIDPEGFESLPTGPLPLKIRTIPAAPLISSPKNEAIIWNSEVELKWLESEFADHYQVQVATDKNFASLIDEQSLPQGSYTTPALEPGNYFFRVRTVTADAFETLFSIPLSFKVVAAPEVGELAPAGGDELNLQWAPMDLVSTYDLQIARDKDFTKLRVDKQGLETPSFTPEEKLSPGTHYVRIRGVMDNGDASPWSPAQSMKINYDPLGWEEFGIAAILLGLILL